MKTVDEFVLLISFMASMPFIPGICMSMKAISGLNVSASSITALPLFAVSVSQSPPNSFSIMNLMESVTIPSSSASIILYICYEPFSSSAAFCTGMSISTIVPLSSPSLNICMTSSLL